MKLLILIDSRKCLGCRSCEIACAVEHSKSKELVEAIKESPRPQYRIQLESLEDICVPLHCRHCEAAPCVQVCPTRAIKKEKLDSPVVIDDKICVGCSFCIIVCQYGIPRLSKEGRALIKCDLCIERLEKGDVPACVFACPTGAIKFVDAGVSISGSKELSGINCNK